MKTKRIGQSSLAVGILMLFSLTLMGQQGPPPQVPPPHPIPPICPRCPECQTDSAMYAWTVNKGNRNLIGTESISAIAAATDFVAVTIHVPPDSEQGGVSAISASPNGKLLYCTRPAGRLSDHSELLIIDTLTKLVSQTISIPDLYARGVIASLDGSKVYVIADSIYVIATSNYAILATIPVGGVFPGLGSVALTPDGSFLYGVGAGVYPADRLVKVNLLTNTVVYRLLLPDQSTDIKITPDGRVAYLTQAYTNKVLVFDLASDTILTTIDVGATPENIAINPAGTLAFVSNGGDGTVSVISTANYAIVATVRVQGGPLGLATTPDGTKLYVCNSESSTVSVVNTNTYEVSSTIPVGIIPYLVVVARSN